MYSSEHLLYLKRQKRKTLFVRFMQVAIIATLIIIWQLLADFHLINTFITSSPKEVIHTILNLHQSNNLYHHIGITIYETFLSFGIGTLLGFIIATILWWFPTLSRIIDPYLTILNSLPKVALGPILIIWAGAGMESIIWMALLISVIITIMNVYQGFMETDSDMMKLMKTFQANKTQIYFKLMLPSSFSNVVSALKINISMSLIGS